MDNSNLRQLTRRACLVNGSIYLLGASGAATAISKLSATEKEPKLRIGLLTDLHYADKPTAGSRHYRDTLAKMEEAAKHFEKLAPGHIVELGDLIDAADSVEVEKRYLKRIQKEFARLPGRKHYVLGNHCVHTLTKEEFLDGVEQKKSHYSFDDQGFHFVVLDACFRSDGKPYGRKNFKWTDPNISAEQMKWFEADLKASRGKTIAFVHQRLDVGAPYGIKNAAAARKIMEDSGKVLAVFQGHSHKNEVKEINGIHYCVHRAMVEGKAPDNSGYSNLDIFADGTLRVTGFRKQKNYDWRR